MNPVGLQRKHAWAWRALERLWRSSAVPAVLGRTRSLPLLTAYHRQATSKTRRAMLSGTRLIDRSFFVARHAVATRPLGWGADSGTRGARSPKERRLGPWLACEAW